ncbi:MAG: transcriptional repressor [Pseudomonadota bacterium]|nr:transcriptional repressor [Pseudomonadota bacterium]
MTPNTDKLSPHSQKVLALLSRSGKPLSAYDILDKLRRFGIKAPPTVYRALDTLVQRGLVHRIESLGAFVACHRHGEDHEASQFAVCRACGDVTELHDERLAALLRELGQRAHFHIERETLEMTGLCQKCSRVA